YEERDDLHVRPGDEAAHRLSAAEVADLGLARDERRGGGCATVDEAQIDVQAALLEEAELLRHERREIRWSDVPIGRLDLDRRRCCRRRDRCRDRRCRARGRRGATACSGDEKRGYPKSQDTADAHPTPPRIRGPRGRPERSIVIPFARAIG